MTAINIVRQEKAVHIISDGAWYAPDGFMKGFATKVFPLPNMPAVIAVRGSEIWLGMLGVLLGRHFETFDDLVAGIEDVLPSIYEQFTDIAVASGSPDFELYIAGISKARGRSESYLIVSNESEVPEGCMSPEAFRLTDLPDITSAPFPGNDLLAEANFETDQAFHRDRIERDGLHLLEIQRRMTFAPVSGAPEGFYVGGFAQLTTVSEDGVKQRIIHRFESDRVGEMLSPEPIDWAARAPAPMTRQQRRAAMRRRAA